MQPPAKKSPTCWMIRGRMWLAHALHDRSSYRIESQGATTSVETTSGIKQGCKVSPAIFSLLTRCLFASMVATLHIASHDTFDQGSPGSSQAHRRPTRRGPATQLGRQQVEMCHPGKAGRQRRPEPHLPALVLDHQCERQKGQVMSHWA